MQLFARLILLAVLLASATPLASAQQMPNGTDDAVHSLKHKVAIGRFSNETRYGRSLLRDGDLDPLGKQASDILAAYLTTSEKFLVLERSDISKIEREQHFSDNGSTVGADVLILGSIVEFGRSENGRRGFFNKSKVQVAHAKVAIRLVDVRTGLVFHSATGAGDSMTETSKILGMGSTADYDATLNDKAISAAIEDVIDEMINTLSDREWRTDILLVESGQVYIAGGKHQGLHVGDRLAFVRSGQTIKSDQSGFDITLPPTPIGQIEVVSLFGETEDGEGAIARVLNGDLPDGRPEGIYVTELGK